MNEETTKWSLNQMACKKGLSTGMLKNWINKGFLAELLDYRGKNYITVQSWNNALYARYALTELQKEILTHLSNNIKKSAIAALLNISRQQLSYEVRAIEQKKKMIKKYQMYSFINQQEEGKINE